MSDAEAGTPFHERFAIRERLGAGGMGVVYAAYDRERDETVALKTLHHRDASALYAFKKEFRTLADVAHPNLVSLYELIAVGDQWFFTMELIDGENFIDHVRPTVGQPILGDSGSELTRTLPLDQTLPAPSQNPSHPRQPIATAFDEARLRSAARQLAIGVRALHNAGKVHRDLKPHNVLVTADGRVVILDFGVARELAPTIAQLTVEAGLPGTLAYMAPEQARGQNATPASDWYAVGVMLFEALTGHLPFTGTISRVLSDKLHKTAPSPRQLVHEPPDDLCELCEDLLARDADNRPSTTGVLARLGGTDSGVPDQSYLPIDAAGERLAGRQSHLQALEKAFGRTLTGEPNSVYVHGTSGMGKTAIVHFFLKGLIERQRAVVLPGRCYAQELVPYKGLDGVVDSLSKYLLSLPRQEVEVLLPREIQALARLFPVLSRVDAVAATSRSGRGAVDLLTRRRLAFSALRELLGRIAEQQPVVLYIDDLQWADADSAALLGDLLRPPAAPPLLLITAFRSEEIASQSFLADLVALADGSKNRFFSLELPVEPLADRYAAKLASALLGGHPGLEALVETIVSEARGNPFLIEQLVSYAMTSGADLAVTGLDSRISLADMLENRIRLLPEGAEALLLILAAAGRPIDAAVAYHAAGLEGDERPLIATLQAAHLVRSSGAARAVELYHDRIREGLASRADPARARRLHLALAATLIERGMDDPEALFTHYRSAGENARAGEQAALAAGKASDALAFDRAALFYLRALDLGGFEAAEEERLRQGLAESLANAGRPADAARVFLELAQVGAAKQHAARDVDVRALAYRSQAARTYLAGGYFDQGFAELRSVLEAVGLKMADSPSGAILSLLWQRLLLRLRGLRFRPRDVERIAEEELLRIDACYAAAAGLTTADTIRGADFHTRQLRLALRAGEPMRVARALGLEVFYLATAGTAAGKRATRILAKTFELARSVDDPLIIGLTHLHAGLLALCRGDWGVAVEQSDEAETIFAERCNGTILETTSARRCGLAARVQRGDLAEISAILPGLLAEADELGNVLAAAHFRARLGIAWLAADDPQGCRQATDRGLRAWTRQGFQLVHFHGLISHCLADLYEGRGQRSYERLTDGWPHGRSSIVTRIQVTRIEGLFLRGRCALAAAVVGRDRDQRLRAADRAARQLARGQPAYALPMVEQIRATRAHLGGDRDAARLGLRRAADGFAAADMHLAAAANRWRWGELTGGDEGRSQVTAAEEWMRDQAIQRPERMVAILVPGFGDAG